jgi:hypothetical protein
MDRPVPSTANHLSSMREATGRVEGIDKVELKQSWDGMVELIEFERVGDMRHTRTNN